LRIFQKALISGRFISATCTDAAGNTSEFSNSLRIESSDTDGDGIPDDFEIAEGLDPENASDAALDLDPKSSPKRA
jgi:hypothetical protein